MVKMKLASGFVHRGNVVDASLVCENDKARTVLDRKQKARVDDVNLDNCKNHSEKTGCRTRA